MEKKELRQDIIREKMLSLVALAYRHRKSLTAGAIALVILTGLGFAYGWYQGQLAGEQAAKFYAAENIMRTSELPEEERRAAAIKALQEFLQVHPDVPLSPYAWMFLAQIYWAGENNDGAKEAFEKVRSHGETTEFTRNLALIGLAKLHEAEKAFEQAAKIYSDLPENPFSDLKAYNQGRMAAANQRPEGARELFKKVINHFPPSQLTGWANDAIFILPATAGTAQKKN